MYNGTKSKKARRRRENAFREQEGLCWYCKQPMVIRVLRAGKQVPPDTCTLEHLRPGEAPIAAPASSRPT